MQGDGWVCVEVVAQEGRPETRAQTPSATGCAILRDWLASPTPLEAFRSETAVKMRGASYADRAAVLHNLTETRNDHAARLAHYEVLEREQFPHPDRLSAVHKDRWLVLRGGIRLEKFWIDWITDYLEAHS